MTADHVGAGGPEQAGGARLVVARPAGYLLECLAGGVALVLPPGGEAGDPVGLGGEIANALAGGNQAFEFIGSRTFSGDAGELRSFSSGGDTYARGDVDGDGKADFSILFEGALSPRASDFLL